MFSVCQRANGVSPAVSDLGFRHLFLLLRRRDAEQERPQVEYVGAQQVRVTVSRRAIPVSV